MPKHRTKSKQANFIQGHYIIGLKDKFHDQEWNNLINKLNNKNNKNPVTTIEFNNFEHIQFIKARNYIKRLEDVLQKNPTITKIIIRSSNFASLDKLAYLLDLFCTKSQVTSLSFLNNIFHSDFSDFWYDQFKQNQQINTLEFVGNDLKMSKSKHSPANLSYDWLKDNKNVTKLIFGNNKLGNSSDDVIYNEVLPYNKTIKDLVLQSPKTQQQKCISEALQKNTTIEKCSVIGDFSYDTLLNSIKPHVTHNKFKRLSSELKSFCDGEFKENEIKIENFHFFYLYTYIPNKFLENIHLSQTQHDTLQKFIQENYFFLAGICKNPSTGPISTLPQEILWQICSYLELPNIHSNESDTIGNLDSNYSE